MAAGPISEQEFCNRHEKVGAFLQENDLGALFAYSPPIEHKWTQTGHVSYLSGWDNHDRIVESAVVIPASGPAALLFAGLPFMTEQVAEVSPIDDVRLVKPVDPNAVGVAEAKTAGADTGPRDFASETLSILDENGLAKEDVGVVGIESMSHPFYEVLADGFGNKLKRCEDIVAELRATKSPAELQAMREAARLSDIGFEAMLEAARPGMKGLEIVTEIERAVRREGADHAKYWMASGPPTDWGESRHDLKPHERVLGEGDMIAACSYVTYKGYWCHGQRAGTLLEPSPALEKIFAVALEAQDTALAVMRPGNAVRQAVEAAREVAGRHGFTLGGGRIGHGMGMDYGERPLLAASNEDSLQEGMTFGMHCNWLLPGSGKLFVPLGDVCCIGAEDLEYLMGFPRGLFLAGQ